MDSLSLILGEVNEVMALIEQQVDQETGELAEMTFETEERLNVGIAKLTKKIDNIGFAMVMTDKEIDGYKAIKAMADAKIKSKQNSTKRFKAYLARIVRFHGTQNENGVYSLKGNIVTAKDNSGYVFKIDKEVVKNSDSTKYEDIIVRFPRNLYDSRPALRKALDTLEGLSIDFEINETRLKKDYEIRFNELNSIKEGITAESLALSLPKDQIKYPQIAGIRKIWEDKTTFLGLKKLSVEDEKSSS